MASRNKNQRSSGTAFDRQIDWANVLGPLCSSFTPNERQLLDAATREHPRRAVRLAPGRNPSDLPLPVEPVPWYDRGYFVTTTDTRPGEWLHYAAGDYYIQDAGSMLALALADIKPDQWVCDVCASPGGKSTGTLEQLDGTGLLVANEVIGSRLGVLQLALARTGYSNYLTMSADAEDLSVRLGSNFDCVIVDAPCTGQTMVGRGKQVLAAYAAQQIEHSAARQRRIIRAASQLVAPGGRLVYSTCAFSFEENEAIVAYLLTELPEWSIHQAPPLAQWESPVLAGCYRLWPHRDGCAGAFAAAITRPLGVGDTDRDSKCHHKVVVEADESAIRSMDWWIDSQPLLDNYQWIVAGKNLQAFPLNAPSPWLPYAISGIPFAEQHVERLEPHPASSWLRARDSVHNVPIAQHNIELDDNLAARYVAGEAISLATNCTGWARIWWRDRPLGWTKVVGNILKNHYPKPLRGRYHA